MVNCTPVKIRKSIFPKIQMWQVIMIMPAVVVGCTAVVPDTSAAAAAAAAA